MCIRDRYKPVPKKEIWHIKGKEVEIIKAPGVVNSLDVRLDVSLLVFTEIEKHLPKWPWPINFKKRVRLL